MRRILAALAVLAATGGCTAIAAPEPVQLRFATFNASLNRASAGELVADLSTPNDPQAAKVAEVIQRVRPDVLLINEFDHDPPAVDLFRTNYLAQPHNGAEPIDYPYSFTAPSNTGEPTGLDLDEDGKVGGGNDAFGFGLFPGQYGMVVYSKYPIDTAAARTFQKFRWKDLPGNRMPTSYYTPEAQAILRLSSKSHWDLPVTVAGRTVHVLVSHPTPPSFDGPDDHNGLRNADEILFWRLYVAAAGAPALVDDAGKAGGLATGAPFVIMGDNNSDPVDGDSVAGAAHQLLTADRVIDPMPTSAGAPEAATAQGGANIGQRGDPRYDTGDFNDRAPGNLRVDYVLPSTPLSVVGSGVFWPVASDPLARLDDTSDHHSVWVDVRVP